MTDTPPSDKIVAQHTPAPWELTADEEGWTIRMDSALADTGHWQVQHRIELEWGDTYEEEGDNSQYEEAEANARLIAAAPDLLAALKLHVGKSGHTAQCPGLNTTFDDCSKRCTATRAAIARATGAGHVE